MNVATRRGARRGGSRRGGSRQAMFLRMLMRAALVRPGRAAAALLAVVVAAAAATAMLNLYVDVQAKLRREFRSYGANIVVIAPEGSALAPDSLSKVDSVLAGKGTAVPFAYAVARTKSGAPVVVASTDLARVKLLDRWWSVSAWPNAAGQALVGVRAARAVDPELRPLELFFAGRGLTLTPAGTLRTGAEEDSRIYLDLPEFTAWTQLRPSTIEVQATGSTADIADAVTRLSAALPGVEVRPIRQIVEGEERVLGKTRASLLAATAVIILTAALCVLATLTAWVLDRRRDFAIMKALGASERLIAGFFAAEAASIGAVGALAGFAIGIGVAAWIGHANFNAAVTPRLNVLPPVLAGSVAVALASAMFPMALLRRVQPATILRGE